MFWVNAGVCNSFFQKFSAESPWNFVHLSKWLVYGRTRPDCDKSIEVWQ